MTAKPQSAAASHAFEPRELIRDLPHRPGTYEMLAHDGTVLYVGKAKDLKRRVSSYFRGRAQNTKTMAMTELVADVRITVTHTESEALLLEYNLIKAHSPKFNVLLRDDKSYPFIRLDATHPFPRLSFYRGPRKQGGRLFGPYPNAGAVRETLGQLQKLFQLRSCEDSYFANRSRPCLQYQIKRCSAPCVGAISAEAYARDLDSAILFLRGRNQTVTKDLAERMDAAAAALDFERAAELRNQLARLKAMEKEQLIANSGDDFDVVGAAVESGLHALAVLYFRGGRLLGSRTFFPRAGDAVDLGETTRAFLLQYYAVGDVPKEIVISEPVEDATAIAAVLGERAGCRVQVRQRVRGQRLRWVQMARANAHHAAERRLQASATVGAQLDALSEALNLGERPARIECFDVSHTGGAETSASCVVFGADGPLKSDYRRFNITGIAAGDDYGAMAQVLRRRYDRVRRGEVPVPDLVLIDGGRGQLAIAAEVFREFQLEGVKLIGVAKGRARRAGMERLFTIDSKLPIRLDAASPALLLIQRIRDEAHRFALLGHRTRHRKKKLASPLESVKGLGPKRRRALLRAFGGLQGVERAGIEELAGVAGISRDLAERVYEHLHAG